MFVFNAIRTIDRALESVTCPSQPPVELLVMDGGSTDGTVDVIRRYEDQISFWRSHRDAGPIAAMNEGIARAMGDIICLLPADDWVEPGALHWVTEEFMNHPQVDVVSCGTRFVRCEPDGRVRQTDVIMDPERLKLSIANIVRCPMTAGHFITRRLYETLGGYDESYAMSNDLDFLIRVCLARPRVAVLPRLVYTYRTHAESRTLGGNSEMVYRMMRDNIRILALHLRSSNTTAEERRELLGMHGRNSARLAWMLLQRGEFQGAARTLLSALSFNKFWPLQIWYWLARRAFGPEVRT